MRCHSPFCSYINEEGIRGREFEPAKNAEGLALEWCMSCRIITEQMQFFSTQTVLMIRTTLKTYLNTPLPKENKLILEQFSNDLLRELGEKI